MDGSLVGVTFVKDPTGVTFSSGARGAAPWRVPAV